MIRQAIDDLLARTGNNDPETGLPHIYNHNVTEDEVEEILLHPGEDRTGSEGSRAAIGKANSG